MFTEKKGKNSDSIKEVISKGGNIYPSDGQDLSIIPFNDKNAFFSRFQLYARGYLRIWTLVATLLANGQMFERSLRGGNLVQNLETFWMNNKTIIEFRFHRMQRIMQISEDVIHLYLQPRWITSFSISITLHILLSSIQLIANCKI